MKLFGTIPAALVMLTLAAGEAAGQSVAPEHPTDSDDAARPVWRIDTSHSDLTFRIRHLVSRVSGTFGEWGGEIKVDPDRLGSGSVEVEIAASTIDTNNERRDGDLRGGDFFDAANHPTITFRGRSLEVQGERIRVAGDLTIRGVTRPVVLEGEYLGIVRDARGRERIGFEAETVIDRHDFGISWNRLVEGGKLLGDEVRISMAVQAIRQ
jgi:polyisoprenoid-binding protein YceI